MNITEKLFSLEDKGYKIYHSKVITNIDKNKIIGIKTSLLRDFAKELYKADNYIDFINVLPHYYYEENNLHAFIIEQIKDFDSAIKLTDKFLQYIDNWATCDMFSPKVFSAHREELLSYIYKWIKSKDIYAVRFGINMLMKHFLDENFSTRYLLYVSKIKSDEYYINMMISWYFATALYKQYDSAIIYLEERKLSKWVHEKTIRKAIESNRISEDTKKYLRTLRY